MMRVKATQEADTEEKEVDIMKIQATREGDTEVEEADTMKIQATQEADTEAAGEEVLCSTDQRPQVNTPKAETKVQFTKLAKKELSSITMGTEEKDTDIMASQEKNITPMIDTTALDEVTGNQ